MMRDNLFRTVLLIFLAIQPAVCPAQPADAPGEQKEPASTDLTVAIVDFDSSSASPELGQQVSQVLTVTLSGEPGFRLVDRSAMDRTLAEHALNLTGVVDANQATKIGKLVGARILVTGKIFLIDKQLFLTAKLIGTETTLVDGVLIKGDKDAQVGDLLVKFSQEVATRLRQRGPTLVAQPDVAPDPLPGLKKRLDGKKLPVVSIHVQERHISAGPAVATDPAVENELHRVFQECGIKIVDGDAKEQAEAGVALVLDGEAFSEYAARIGNLISCEARVEVKVTDRKSSQVLFSDRETTRAVDLAENVAGKTALQKAGRIVGLRLLQKLADRFDPKGNKPRKE